MNNEFYDSSLESWAAYARLVNFSLSDVIENLHADGFSDGQVSYFLERFPVVKDGNFASGLNAYLLDDPSDGMTVAFRGTEFSFSDPEQGLASLLDILNDGGLVFGLSSILDFFQLGQVSAIDRFLVDAGLVTENGQVVEAWKSKITFTGHSLGGHLALLAAYKYPGLVKAVYTFNGAGAAPLDRLWLDYLLPVAQDCSLDVTKVFNVFADKGAELTAADNFWFARPGVRERVFIEQGGDFENHAIAKLVQSLAVSRILHMLDPVLGTRDAYRILDAAHFDAGQSLSQVRQQLAHWAPLADPAAVAAAAADAELLYQALLPWQALVAVLPTAAWGSARLLENALADTAAGRTVRHALLLQQPMALLAADGLPVPGTLSALDAGYFTDAFWEDRARFYQHLMDATRRDSLAYAGESAAGRAVTYRSEDGHTLDTRAWAAGHRPLSVAWSPSAEGGPLSGSTGDDHLYGWLEADQLSGQAGNDYLDGLDGDDTLAGGRGHDVLHGGAGQDQLLFDWSHAQEGHDRVMDVAWATDRILIDGRRITAAARREGFAGVHVPEGRDAVLVRSSGGVLVADRAHGFANSLWLSDGPGTQEALPWQAPVAPDLEALLGAPYLSWDAAGRYGEQVLADGRLNQRDAWEGRFDGSRLNDRATGGVLDDELHGNSGDDWLRGGGSMDLLFGGPGSDWLYGEEGRDFLFGQDFWSALDFDTPADRDLLDGGAGDDWLLGGNGEDTLLGQAGTDNLFGNPGRDWLSGGADADFLWGDSAFSLYASWVRDTDPGSSTTYRHVRPLLVMIDQATATVPWGELQPLSHDDVLEGGAGHDWLFGELGHDLLDGGADDDMLFGDRFNSDPQFPETHFLHGFSAFGPNTQVDGMDGVDPVSYRPLDPALHGHDILLGGSGHDALYGNGGDDLLHGGADNDYLHGDDDVLEQAGLGGADRLFGEAGNDNLLGGAGDDWLDGGADNDYLQGGQGNDRLLGDAGRDRLYGDAGADALDGGAGDDTLAGGDGDDLLDGGAGQDVLDGGEGHDWLAGGAGNDRLAGGGGNDLLDGGAGNDRLAGGEGEDTYVFHIGDGHDVLTDDGHDTRLRFEGGITREDFSWQWSPDKQTGFLSYSTERADTVQFTMAEPVADYRVYFWDGGAQSYTDISLYALIDHQPPKALADLGLGTDYNDSVDFTQSGFAGPAWHGGFGQDTVRAAAGDAAYYGDWDADTLVGANGNVSLHGGSGADTLVAGDDRNSLYGGLDDDTYDIGLWRPAVQELSDAGTDTLRAQAIAAETLRLPEHVERLELAAGGVDITLLPTPGDQVYAIDAGRLWLQLDAAAGHDILQADAPVTVSLPPEVRLDAVAISMEDGGLRLALGEDSSLLLQGPAGNSRSFSNVRFVIGGQEVQWLPVSPVHYLRGTEGDDRFVAYGVEWLNGLQPMGVIRDPGGDDGLLTAHREVGNSLFFQEAGRSGDDLVLRFQAGGYTGTQPAVQWRIRDWYLGEQHRIEGIALTDEMRTHVPSQDLATQPAFHVLENHAPRASTISLQAVAGEAMAVPLEFLLAGVTDSDGDAVVVNDLWGSGVGLDDSRLIVSRLGITAAEGLQDIQYRVSDGLAVAFNRLSVTGLAGGVAHEVNASGAAAFLSGGGQGDVLRGTAGADWLYGHGGDDRLVGGAGRDSIDGGAGDDRLRGSDGDDHLVGGDGNDFLRGEAGADWLVGGPGSDTYLYALGDGWDVIDDYRAELLLQGDGPVALSPDQDCLVVSGLTALDALWLRREFDDLVVEFLDHPGDGLRIDQWFSGNPFVNGQLVAIRADSSEGQAWLRNPGGSLGSTDDAFDRLLATMSQYERPAGSAAVPEAVRQAVAEAWAMA